jgi:hypothetical protein
MSLAIDTTTTDINGAHQLALGTTSWSHTCTGSNLVLIVNLAVWNNGGTAAGMTTVTYGAQSMTLVGTGASNGSFYTEQWQLIAPSTGAHTILGTQVGTSDAIKTSAVSLTGADQTTPVDVSTSTTGTAGSVTAALTLGTANEYMIDIVNHLSANNPSSHSDTQVLNDASLGVNGASQYGLKTSSGSQSMSWTYPDPGDAWAYSVLAIKAASSSVNVSVAQVAATLTVTGGTQSIATVNIVSISQTTATLIATGGTQVIATVNKVSLAQVAATLILAGGVQAVATSNFVDVSQLAASIVASGGIQAVVASSVINISITQVRASLLATGGSQVVIGHVPGSNTYKKEVYLISGLIVGRLGTLDTKVILLDNGTLALKIKPFLYMSL